MNGRHKKKILTASRNAQAMLKKREAWKYEDIKKWLRSQNIEYEFEFLLGEFFIYDLCLKDYRLLFEFDGSSHDNKLAIIDDFEKDNVAEQNGYEVIRIKVDDNLVIPAETVAGILSNYEVI